MIGDPPIFPQYWPPYPYYYPVYTPTYGYTVPMPCKWFKDEGNERFMFFASCGAQIEYDQPWWKHCPKCGGLIERPAETQEVKHE